MLELADALLKCAAFIEPGRPGLARLRILVGTGVALAVIAAAGNFAFSSRDANGQDTARPLPDALERQAMKMWKVMTTGIDTNLRGVSLVAPPTGQRGEVVVWASGSNGMILKSVDSGRTWQQYKVPGGETLDFRGIRAFTTASAYVMSSGEGDKSRIYKTTDGGATWTLQFTDTRPTFFLDAIACDGERKCVALSDPVDGKFVIVRTTDGENWQIAPNQFMPPALKDEGAFAASNSSLMMLHAGRDVDHTLLYFATGGPSGARVFRSPDFGKSWSTTDTPLAGGNASSGVFSIARFNGENIIVGGDYKKPDATERTAAYSSDHTQQYELAQTAPSGYRSSVTSLGGKMLVAVGPNGSDFSDDGGRTWKRSDLIGLNALEAIRRGGGSDAWAVGPNGTVERLVQGKWSGGVR